MQMYVTGRLDLTLKVYVLRIVSKSIIGLAIVVRILKSRARAES